MMSFDTVKKAHALVTTYERLQRTRDGLKELIERGLPSGYLTIVAQDPKGKTKGETDVRFNVEMDKFGIELSLAALLGSTERMMDDTADSLRALNVGDA